MNQVRPSKKQIEAYIDRLQNPYAKEQVLASASFFDRPSGNPYAGLADTAEGVSLASLPKEPKLSLVGVSKEFFENSCRRIFIEYIPALERRQLRPHHRNFILRNRERSSTARARMLQELERYDLSKGTPVRAHFNRERDPFTEAKLKEVEALAGE